MPQSAVVITDLCTAGDSGSRYGVDRILASRPLTFIGGNSYALYLWHWPLLIVFLTLTGTSSAGAFAGAAIIAVSFGLAVLSTRYVEKPIRSWEWASTGIVRPAIVLLEISGELIADAVGVAKFGPAVIIDTPYVRSNADSSLCVWRFPN
jgi:peptidoglycan/LPS O-acetylase OafA/YrhL